MTVGRLVNGITTSSKFSNTYLYKRMVTSMKITFKGGTGSGNFGHAGRPGKRGGSAPKGSAGGQVGNPRQYIDNPRQYIQGLTSRGYNYSDVAGMFNRIVGKKNANVADYIHGTFDDFASEGYTTKVNDVRPAGWSDNLGVRGDIVFNGNSVGRFDYNLTPGSGGSPQLVGSVSGAAPSFRTAFQQHIQQASQQMGVNVYDG